MKQQTNKTLRKEIRSLSPWFHNLHLPDGTQTAPDHALGDFPAYKWKRLSRHLPQRMKGWRVLDVGCNAGFYSFQLAQRGAIVTAIDVDERYLNQARWAARKFNLQDQIEFRRMPVYELAKESEKYDLVLFMGVFYHLRYPLLGLDIVARRVKRLLIFQTLTTGDKKVARARFDYGIDERRALDDKGWPRMSFIEHSFASDITNWWIPNHAGVLALLRSAGMKVIKQPGHEIYICRPMRSSRSYKVSAFSSELKNPDLMKRFVGDPDLAKDGAARKQRVRAGRTNSASRNGSRR